MEAIKSKIKLRGEEKMRKSIIDIAHMVKEIDYPGGLPAELKEFHSYIVDGGHVLMCIPKQFMTALSSDKPYMYEAPIPVKYVMEKGYELVDDYLLVDVLYDGILGVVVDEIYDEF